jgi:uncharacterized membrane protein
LGAGVQSILASFFHILVIAFVVGMVGCVLVIPITAFRLFHVLFEKDEPEGDAAVGGHYQ